jgi:hypothetical protein
MGWDGLARQEKQNPQGNIPFTPTCTPLLSFAPLPSSPGQGCIGPGKD